MTMLTPESRAVLEAMAAEVAHLPGDVAELGVFRGGSAVLLHRALPGKRLHLFDTFAGLPDPDPAMGDTHPAGRFRAAPADVLAQLSEAPVTLHIGRFPESVSGLTLPPLCLAHIDADLYWSVRHGLEVFWPRLVPGGVIVLDDYGWDDCRGARKAVDEFGGADVLDTNQAILRRVA